MRKEATLDMWKELYEVTANLKSFEPWNYLWDQDLIVIQLGPDAEPVFCSIMGRGGSCYGIAAYVGMEGLQDFYRIVGAENSKLPMEYIMFDQSNLTCYFGDREEVPPEQKKCIKELGLKFRGKGQWAYFVSYKKRYQPYIPDEAEVCLLIEVYKNLCMSLRALLEGRIKIDFAGGACLWRRFNQATELWDMFGVPLPEVHLDVLQMEVTDTILKQRLKKQPAIEAGILLDLFYMNASIKDEKNERPKNPLMLAAADADTGMMIFFDIIPQDMDEMQAVLQYFIDFVQNHGRMKIIRARNPLIFGALSKLCAECKVKLLEDDLRPLDEFMKELKAGL